ncbi:MAG: 30S ribosomal protein S8 [Bdellovibrionales bacterium]|nr:30S ribosomal protein S8 [Bdellovibrionales bacterium]
MDTIGDFLTRIRNAGMAKHEKVDFPCSTVRQGIAKVLQSQGYIRDFRVARDGKQGVMRVYLKYNEKGDPVIKHLSRVSRPSKRIYVRATEIPKVRSGFGLAILSTNKGILSGDDAVNQNVGGELLCKVW